MELKHVITMAKIIIYKMVAFIIFPPFHPSLTEAKYYPIWYPQLFYPVYCPKLNSWFLSALIILDVNTKYEIPYANKTPSAPKI